MGYGMMDGYGYAGFLGFGWIFNLLIWGAIIAGIVYLIRQVATENRTQQKTPLDIIKERYAKGELTKEEFEQKKKDLEK